MFSSYSLIPLKDHLLIARGISTSASRVTSCIVVLYSGNEHEITEKINVFILNLKNDTVSELRLNQ